MMKTEYDTRVILLSLYDRLLEETGNDHKFAYEETTGPIKRAIILDCEMSIYKNVEFKLIFNVDLKSASIVLMEMNPNYIIRVGKYYLANPEYEQEIINDITSFSTIFVKDKSVLPKENIKNSESTYIDFTAKPRNNRLKKQTF